MVICKYDGPMFAPIYVDVVRLTDHPQSFQALAQLMLELNNSVAVKNSRQCGVMDSSLRYLFTCFGVYEYVDLSHSGHLSFCQNQLIFWSCGSRIDVVSMLCSGISNLVQNVGDDRLIASCVGILSTFSLWWELLCSLSVCK